MEWGKPRESTPEERRAWAERQLALPSTAVDPAVVRAIRAEVEVRTEPPIGRSSRSPFGSEWRTCTHPGCTNQTWRLTPQLCVAHYRGWADRAIGEPVVYAPVSGGVLEHGAHEMADAIRESLKKRRAEREG